MTDEENKLHNKNTGKDCMPSLMTCVVSSSDSRLWRARGLRDMLPARVRRESQWMTGSLNATPRDVEAGVSSRLMTSSCVALQNRA
jgi:hypothetical protein